MTAPYPRVSPCRHCGLVVLRDNDGVWIHTSLAYVCRDRAGNLRHTYAEPERPALPNRPPVSPNRPPAAPNRPRFPHNAPPGSDQGRRSWSPTAGHGSATV